MMPLVASLNVNARVVQNGHLPRWATTYSLPNWLLGAITLSRFRSVDWRRFRNTGRAGVWAKEPGCG
jgi:hypothetical protein